jgi:hypothetical protein
MIRFLGWLGLTVFLVGAVMTLVWLFGVGDRSTKPRRPRWITGCWVTGSGLLALYLGWRYGIGVALVVALSLNIATIKLELIDLRKRTSSRHS